MNKVMDNKVNSLRYWKNTYNEHFKNRKQMVRNGLKTKNMVKKKYPNWDKNKQLPFNMAKLLLQVKHFKKLSEVHDGNIS